MPRAGGRHHDGDVVDSRRRSNGRRSSRSSYLDERLRAIPYTFEITEIGVLARQVDWSAAAAAIQSVHAEVTDRLAARAGRFPIQQCATIDLRRR